MGSPWLQLWLALVVVPSAGVLLAGLAEAARDRRQGRS